MSNLNIVTLGGRLSRDPELRTTSGGTAVVNFTIKQTEKYNDEQRTHFFDIVMFGKMAEVVNEYFHKDKAIIVTGRIQQERWEKDGEKRSKLSILAREFNFPPRDFDGENSTTTASADAGNETGSTYDPPF